MSRRAENVGRLLQQAWNVRTMDQIDIHRMGHRFKPMPHFTWENESILPMTGSPKVTAGVELARIMHDLTVEPSCLR
jgi:hypothetical protein